MNKQWARCEHCQSLSCLFTKKSRQIENIQPTSVAILQHVKRAVYQAGHIWGRPLCCHRSSLTLVTGVGTLQWTRSPFGLPQASEACREMIKCACTKGCNKRCKCVREGVKCTALCDRNGDCVGNRRGSAETVPD